MSHFDEEQLIEPVSEEELEVLAEEEAATGAGEELVEEDELEKVNVKSLTWFLGLSSAAAILPLIAHIQQFTGPIINAILVLLLFIVGAKSALVVSLIPSLMALASGLLPAVLAPAVPFIMVSNVVFVLTIFWFYNQQKNPVRGYWLGVTAGAALKFAFLSLSVQFVTKLLLRQEAAPKVAIMLGWPQFVTAVIGGAIAWGVLKWLKKI